MISVTRQDFLLLIVLQAEEHKGHPRLIYKNPPCYRTSSLVDF